MYPLLNFNKYYYFAIFGSNNFFERNNTLWIQVKHPPWVPPCSFHFSSALLIGNHYPKVSIYYFHKTFTTSVYMYKQSTIFFAYFKTLYKWLSIVEELAFFCSIKKILHTESFKHMQKLEVLLQTPTYTSFSLMTNFIIAIYRLLYLSPTHSSPFKSPNHSESNPIHAKLLKV